MAEPMDDMELIESEAPAYHGYAPPREPRAFRPPLSIAISRETGSRGGSIARRTAELLGWQCIDQETLEYMTHDAGICPPMDEPIGAAAEQWIEDRLADLKEAGTLPSASELGPLVRVLLELAARGRYVILGRGAGCVLPAESKLHVRLVAPEKDRIAYLAQLERLSLPEAQRVVRERDESRREFITSRFGRAPDHPAQYDLILNTAQFGIELSAEILVAAAKARERYLQMLHGEDEAES